MHSSSAKLLTVPRHNLSLNSCAFRISAPTTCNLLPLPQNVRDCSSLASFRNHLKIQYFNSAFSTRWHLTHMRLDSNLTTALYKSFTYLLNNKLQLKTCSKSTSGHAEILKVLTVEKQADTFSHVCCSWRITGKLVSNARRHGAWLRPTMPCCLNAIRAVASTFVLW